MCTVVTGIGIIWFVVFNIYCSYVCVRVHCWHCKKKKIKIMHTKNTLLHVIFFHYYYFVVLGKIWQCHLVSFFLDSKKWTYLFYSDWFVQITILVTVVCFQWFQGLYQKNFNAYSRSEVNFFIIDKVKNF